MRMGKYKLWIRVLLALGFLFGTIQIFAQGRNEEGDKRPFPAIHLQGQMRGEQAIQALGPRLPEVAEWYGKTTSELARLLRHDRSLWVSRNGRLMYACELDVPSGAEAPAQSTQPLRDLIVEYPLDQTFQLHSLPGSNRVVYLDFTGGVISGTAWNSNFNGGQDIIAAPFSLDSDPNTFSNTELERIQRIWRRVAEDYVPFDVDVTTEEPEPAALTRNNSSDEYYGNTVMITPTNFYPNAGGVSYIGTFNEIGNYYKPSWAFSNMLANGEKYIAEACSHENGHAVGLHHQGLVGGATYYQGQGEWAPIMGNSYYRNVTQWARGEYADANNTEDQLQIIQNYGLAYYPDDHGNDAQTSSVLEGVTSLHGYGFIEQNTDVDVFQFVTGAGLITLDVIPVPLGPDLKILAELRDDSWNLLASSSLSDLSANISETVPAGAYYLAISGTGSGDPLTTGYTDYASLGQYEITGTVMDPGSLNPPTAEISALPASGEAPLGVSFSGAGSSDDDGLIVAYAWNFDDGSPISGDPSPFHTFDSSGNYDVTLTVTDNDGLKGSSSETISVTKIIYVDSIMLSSESSTDWVSAEALVKIVDKSGNPINGAAVTGEWSGVVTGSSSGSTGYVGTASLASPVSSNSGTFTFRVTNVSAPGHIYDSALDRQTEASIYVELIAQDPLLISITSPASGQTVSGTVPVQVSASSSVAISFAELKVDGASLGKDRKLPYSFSWDTGSVTPGSHRLVATVKDKSGSSASDSIDLIVEGGTNYGDEDEIPPEISVTSPGEGAIVSGIVWVSVDASDNVEVTEVELYVDDQLKAKSTSAPFTLKWNTNKASEGAHIIQAKAYDAAGNSAVSQIVNVSK